MINKLKEVGKQKKLPQHKWEKAVQYNASLQLAYKISRYFGTNIEDVFIFEEE